MKIKSRRFLEVSLMIGGVVCLGIWGWSVVREELYEDWSNWTFDHHTAGQPTSASDYGEYVKDRLTGTAKFENPTIGVLNADPSLLGRLKIPRLGLQAVVREGTGEKTLSLALGHIAGTARPGQNGNVGVAGHRDSLFRGLRNIRVNDRVEFETADGDSYTYQVQTTQIVKPAQVNVLNAGVYPELTLVTCYPFNYIGSAPDRFIVKARQIAQTTKAFPATEIAALAPPPPPPTPSVRSVPPRRENPRRVPFELAMNHSRQLAPGISFGLTRADATRGTIDGWMWVMPERRTIWLHDQSTRQPIVVYGSDGGRRQLVIDSVNRNSIHGYVLL